MGNDVIYSDHGPENLGFHLIEVGGAGYSYGGGGNDSLHGGGSTDVLHGDEGNDLLFCHFGADFLAGGTGNDTLYGGQGNDWAGLEGGDGNDRIYGGAGNDRIYSGRGSDLIFGDAGDDDISGDSKDDSRDATDRDTLSYAGVGGAVTVDLALAFPQNIGAGGWDAIQGIERLIGSRFSDVLSGAATAETLTGGAGNDTLNGRGGNDRLEGGASRDALTGGTGRDTFVFNTGLSSANRTTITDFNAVEDTLALDDAIFAAIGTQLSAGEFRTGSQALDADDRIIHDPTSRTLAYDADGVGGQAGIVFAVIGRGLTIGADDFLIF